MRLIRRRFRQLLRYCAVSVVSTVTSLSVLGVLIGTRSMTAGWANVVATAAGTVPSFELNRRWVWGRTGRRSATRELAPFWLLSFAGLGLSTLVVHRAAAWADRSGLSNGARTIAAELANLAAFGSLWVLQFVLLDRVVFHHRNASAAMRSSGSSTDGLTCQPAMATSSPTPSRADAADAAAHRAA